MIKKYKIPRIRRANPFVDLLKKILTSKIIDVANKKFLPILFKVNSDKFDLKQQHPTAKLG